MLADLRARQVIVSTRIDAPNKGTSKGRVSWLLRQLTEAPDDLSIEARLARSQASLAAPIRLLRENPGELYPEAGREIRQFVISATRNLGLKRDATQGSFIYSVVTTAKEFYRDVLQNLRAWKAPPPKLKEAKEEEPAAWRTYRLGWRTGFVPLRRSKGKRLRRHSRIRRQIHPDA